MTVIERRMNGPERPVGDIAGWVRRAVLAEPSRKPSVIVAAVVGVTPRVVEAVRAEAAAERQAAAERGNRRDQPVSRLERFEQRRRATR